MATMSVALPRYIDAWVDIDEGEANVEGHWYAPAEADVSFAASSEACPFCKRQLQAVKARSLFGRIVKDKEQHQDGKTAVVVELLPASHQALICEPCDTVFTRLREEAAA